MPEIIADLRYFFFCIAYRINLKIKIKNKVITPLLLESKIIINTKKRKVRLEKKGDLKTPLSKIKIAHAKFRYMAK
jgi:predicted transcriptional regulator